MFALFLLAPIALMLLPMWLGRIEQRTLQESARVREGVAAPSIDLDLPQD